MNKVFRCELKPFIFVTAFTLILSVWGCDIPDRQKGSTTDHEAPEAGEPELAVHMDYIQKYSQKLGLAINGVNRELAEFYLHELEERLSRVIDEVPQYEGFRIAEFTETMLMPTLEPLDQQVEQENWPEAFNRYEQMITTCNSCHVATDHGFIKVTANPEKNPFNQIFESDNR